MPTTKLRPLPLVVPWAFNKLGWFDSLLFELLASPALLLAPGLEGNATGAMYLSDLAVAGIAT